MGLPAIPFQATLSPVDADTTFWGDNIINTSNGDTWTANGLSTTDGFGHTVKIANVAGAISLTTNTITVYGTDWSGATISETLTGPGSGSNVNTTGYFNSVTSIVWAGGDIGASVTLDIGMNANAVSDPYFPSWTASALEINTSTSMATTAVQYSRSPNVQASTPPYVANNYVAPSDWIWIDWTAASTGVYQTLYSPVSIRFVMSSYTSGQTLTFCYSQPRNR